MPIDDYLVAVANQRFRQIEAQKVQAQADLATAQACGDQDGTADAIEAIGSCEQRLHALADMHQRYVQSQTPPPAATYPGSNLGLTPQQAEAARVCGLTPEQYVQGLWLQ